MDRPALGLIETRGMIGAVEAADAALKAADVRLEGCECVRGGIVTVEISGDVSAVKTAVDSAKTAVERLGTLRTTHVIPRASDEVWKMLYLKKKNASEDIKNYMTDRITDDNIVEDECLCKVEEQNNTDGLDDNAADVELPEESVEITVDGGIKTREELETMKVPELRNLARQINITSLTKKQIKFGKKEELIKAIIDYYDGR